MNAQMTEHFKIWGTLAVAKAASWGLDEFNTLASIIALLCGAVASIAVAWYHIKKK